jgi:hypothetical protein
LRLLPWLLRWAFRPLLRTKARSTKTAKHADKHDHDWKDKDDDDRGWEKHDRYEMRVFGRNDGYPRGWSKGRKTGWRDCGLPPGQAKKYGCYTYLHGGRRYYYYHDDGGRLIIRRPLIHISGDVVVR